MVFLTPRDNARDEPAFPDGLETDAVLDSEEDTAPTLLILPWYSPFLHVPTLQPLPSAPMTMWPVKPSGRAFSALHLAQPMQSVGQKDQVANAAGAALSP